MDIEIDWDACASTGSCVQICPEVFSLDASGQLCVADHPNEEFRPDVEEAAAMCPTAAITVHP